MKVSNKRSSALSKIHENTCNELLHRERSILTTEACPIPLITTNGAGMLNLTKIMRKHWDTLLSSPLVKEVMSPKPQVAYGRPENIKDQLVRGSIKYPTTAQQAYTPVPI